MSEDKKDAPSPRPNPPVTNAPTAASEPQTAPAGASQTPTAQPPKPAPIPPRTVPPVPPSRPQPKADGRRGFLKVMLIVGAVLSVIPFVPWGEFLKSSVIKRGGSAKQQVYIDNDRHLWGSAAGKAVNVNDLNLFPPNSHYQITYPSSGDHTLDAQNPDTFVKFDLIRLPSSLGGDAKDATAFVAFSKVCVHLWCSPSYKTASDHLDYECPCHGSIYEIPDGKAVLGPASLQAPPTNAIPMLTLTSDSTGALFIEKFVDDVEKNGSLGYGRDYNSYKNYILPIAQGKLAPPA